MELTHSSWKLKSLMTDTCGSHRDNPLCLDMEAHWLFFFSPEINTVASSPAFRKPDQAAFLRTAEAAAAGTQGSPSTGVGVLALQGRWGRAEFGCSELAEMRLCCAAVLQTDIKPFI